MTKPERLSFLLPDMRGGGAERVVLQLMEDFLAAGHEVDLVLMAAQGELLPLVPEEVNVVDLKAPRIRQAVRPLSRYLRERRPRALQASMWPLTTAAVIARRLARSPARLVLAEHTTLSREYAHDGNQSLLAWQVLRRSINWSYPQAEARVVVSERAADALAEASGLDRSSIEVIYNPVAPPPPDNSAPAEIEALWGDAVDRILTVGKLKGAKNHAMLIKAFARMPKRRPAKLLILGDGELAEPLQALANELGVADQVIMPGFTTNPWPYYASATAFALSSDREGYPLVLVEALYCGLPIVSTDCASGPREILDNGRFGVLTPVGDVERFASALAAVGSGPADAATLRNRAEQLSRTDASSRYLALMLGT